MTGIILSWFGLIVSIFVFFGLVEISWRVFLWTFKIVDDHIQEKHMQKLYRMKKEDLQKMFSESQEMAA